MAVLPKRIDTLQTVELAEGMEIHLRTAGPFLRFTAYLLDIIFELLLLYFVSLFVGFFTSGLGGNVSGAINALMGFVIWWFYHVIFELSPWGATPGKKIFGLRVVTTAGAGVTLGPSMVRNFIRGIEMVLPFVPLIAFFNQRFQRLGDLAAGTLVVYAKPRVDPMEVGMSPAPSVPLALSLSREEESALLSFRYRSASWSASRQVELANHLAKMTGEIGPKGVQRALGMANWIEEQR